MIDILKTEIKEGDAEMKAIGRDFEQRAAALKPKEDRLTELEKQKRIVMEQQPELQSKTELAATKPTPLLPSKDVDFGCGHNVLVVDVVAAASASLLRHRR